MSLIDELFSLLQPVLFWLANILEFYQFLTTHHSSLHLALPSQTSEGEGGDGKEAEQTRDEDENPLVTLQNVMIYTFQQAFYPVSKVCIAQNDLHDIMIPDITQLFVLL